MQNNKTLLFALCGLFYISTSFGMEKTDSDNTVMVFPQQYGNLSSLLPSVLSKSAANYSQYKKAIHNTIELSDSFELRINPTTKMAVLHNLAGDIFERVRVGEKNLTQILPPNNSNKVSLSNPIFCFVKKNDTFTEYKIVSAKKTQPLSDLDKATELNPIDHHAVELASDRKWMIGLALGIPLVGTIIGLGALYTLLRIVENFHSNK
jgi:hypothetical protein